ncbi:MAG: InlB B-repeat-containing protein [Clostridiales bacterium]|nr:InlB B-repeat-containing protein [Clostridiales bacterium]
MKNFRRVMIAAVFAVILALGAVCLTACGDKGKSDGNTKPRYTLTFMVGTVVYDTVPAEAGSKYTVKEDPYRVNYVFEGWSRKPNGEVEALPDKMPNENRTYYAIFSARFNLNFNAGIGSIPDDKKTISVKEGDDLYSLVKDVTPTVADSDATFKGWFLRGTSEITATSGLKMPNANAEVVAKYSVNYTINIYLENGFESGDYADEPDDVVREVAFVGDKVTGLPTYAGYYYDDSKENDVLYTNLNKSSAQNAFELYYKLIGYDTIFNANLPSDVEYTGAMDTKICGYGIEYDAPECEFEADGYRFYGWSTAPDGDVEYRVGEKFAVERATTLYAQWVKGMTEIAGLSSDRVYLISQKVGGSERLIPYLERTGLADIAGEYNATTHVFTFKNANAANPDEVLLRGIADSAHNTFTYLNTQNTTVYKLIKLDGTEDANVTLKLNDNGTAVYYDGTDNVNGSYIGGSDGSMLFTVDGEMRFAFRLVHSSDGMVNFMIRGEEYGAWNNISQSGYVDTDYTLSLDGYGHATMSVSGLNSSQQTVTNYLSGRYVYNSGDDAYSGDAGTEVVVIIYNSSLQYRSFACLLMEGSYHSQSSDDTTVYTNVYLQRFETTLYGAPEGDAELDTATADKIELAGYSVVDESATYTYKDDNNVTVTVTGKYAYDSTAGTLRIIRKDGGKDLLFEVSLYGEDSIPVFEPVDELFGQYVIYGLDSSFVPGAIYRLHIYNNNRAAFAFRMPLSDSFYGNIAYEYTRLIYGEYSIASYGQTSDGGSDPRANVYEYTAEISYQMVALIYNMYGTLYGTPLDVSGFANFKFQFVYSSETGNITRVNVTIPGDFQGGYKITYNDVEYTLDGFGTAESESGNLKYVYTTSLGLPTLLLYPYENNTKDYVLYIDYRGTGNYVEYVYDYTATNSSTRFVMMLFKDGTALLTLNGSSSLNPFSFGRITWDDEDHTSGKYERDNSVEFSDIYVGVNKTFSEFKFALITTTETNSQGESTTVTRLYICDDGTNEVNDDGECVIENSNGDKLTINRTDITATYVQKGVDGGEDRTFTGSYRYFDGKLQLIFATSYAITFKLEYDENNEITGFVVVRNEAGYFLSYDDLKSYIYLTGEQAENEGEYSATYYEYDAENEQFVTYDGTYKATTVEGASGYDFIYATGETDEEGSAVTETLFTFATTADTSGIPLFVKYTMQLNTYVLYMSASIGEPAAIGTLTGGGYEAQVLTIYPNTVYQTQYQGSMEWSDEYMVWVFTATDGSTFYFKMLSGVGVFLLDNTYVAETKGIFQLSSKEPIEVEVPATEGQPATEDTPEVPAVPAHTAHVTSIEMSGMAFAYLHYDYNGEDKVITGIYVQYATNGFAFLQIGEESTTALFRFRLMMNTDDDTGEVTYVAEVADMDLYGTFEGDDLTVINLNGFDYAYYVDSYGRVYGGGFVTLESDETSVLIRITYIDTVNYAVNYVYARLDIENHTFVLVDAPSTNE